MITRLGSSTKISHGALTRDFQNNNYPYLSLDFNLGSYYFNKIERINTFPSVSEQIPNQPHGSKGGSYLVPTNRTCAPLEKVTRKCHTELLRKTWPDNRSLKKPLPLYLKNIYFGRGISTKFLQLQKL